MKAYQQKKTVAEQADAYKKDLWEKAKDAGNTGDQDAATRLANLEHSHEKRVEQKTTTSTSTSGTTGTSGSQHTTQHTSKVQQHHSSGVAKEE